MRTNSGSNAKLERLLDLMRDDGASATAMAAFEHHYRRFSAGATGVLDESEISPVGQLPDSDGFAGHRKAGLEALHRTAVVKLNGGLGTGMGLESAKSLLPVRGDLSFLDLIARQIAATRSGTAAGIPLILMNSSRTSEDSAKVLAAYPEIEHAAFPLEFQQNRVPKILEADLGPAEHARHELRWCPPGHGDLYTAIAGTGLLHRMVDAGFDYAFVSNADNLGAVLDTGILGFMVEGGHDFIMEAADRTAADRKGGHLCHLADGRLALRESAQCRPDDEAAFQDITRHRYFNTNNLWLRLPSLSRVLDENGGFLPLDTIVNRKTVDPRDPESDRVIQLETAMGAAISVFDNAAAVRVPRSRFSPVKNTNDLLGVRSDAFHLTDDWRVVLDPGRTAPPVVRLDSSHYKMIDDFERRFPSGPPSLVGCDSLTVEGDITFGSGIVVGGHTTLRSNRPHTIPDDSTLNGELEF